MVQNGNVDFSKKGEVVREISKRTEVSIKDVNEVINAFQDVVSDSLKVENPVALNGFGKFLVRDRAARKGRNPQTGEEIMIPAGKTYSFRFSETYLKNVRGQ